MSFLCGLFSGEPKSKPKPVENLKRVRVMPKVVQPPHPIPKPDYPVENVHDHIVRMNKMNNSCKITAGVGGVNVGGVNVGGRTVGGVNVGGISVGPVHIGGVTVGGATYC